MNKKPDTSGISLYWKPGEDDRVLVMNESGEPMDTVDRVLNALQKIIMSRKRTKIVGFGVFVWRRWKNRIPTGRIVNTWRLSFKAARKAKEEHRGHRR